MTYIEKCNSCSKNNQDFISFLLTRIANKTISKEEIERKVVDSWQKDILLIAWYETRCVFKGLPFIKGLKEKYAQDFDKLKIINETLQRFKNKRRVPFDITIYEDLLQCKVQNKKVTSRVTIGVIPEENVCFQKRQELIKEENLDNISQNQGEKVKKKMIRN